MKNPFLISLRPSVVGGATGRCDSVIGEAQTSLVTSLVAALVPTPRSKFNLIQNPFSDDPTGYWTFTNCSHFAQSVDANGVHSEVVTLTTPATASIQLLPTRFAYMGQQYTLTMKIRNMTGTAKNATVTFLRNMLADGSNVGGSNPSQTLSVPARGTATFQITTTPTAPWFSIRIDTLAAWSGSIELLDPIVNPGAVGEPFFSYKTKPSELFPNPGLADSGPRTTWGFSSYCQVSELGWLFHPVARQWVINPWFRSLGAGYTVTNATPTVSATYKAYAPSGPYVLTATGANARASVTLTVTNGELGVFCCQIYNRAAVSRIFQLRIGGVVQASMVIPAGQEATHFVQFTGNGAATAFDLNVLDSANTEVFVVQYFGVTTGKGQFSYFLPFLGPSGPVLGTFTGTADQSIWDSSEMNLIGPSRSNKSKNFYYLTRWAGAVAMRYWDMLPLVGAADFNKGAWVDDIYRWIFAATSTKYTSIQVNDLAGTSSLSIAGTPNQTKMKMACWMWDKNRQKILFDEGGVTGTAQANALSTSSELFGDYRVGLGQTGEPMAAIVASVLIGRRWPTDDEWDQLKARNLWTYNTPVLPSGRMRVKRISSNHLRIRVVGSGSGDA